MVKTIEPNRPLIELGSEPRSRPGKTMWMEDDRLVDRIRWAGAETDPPRGLAGQ